jgi:hemerythrin-like domain-containing protein
MSEAALTDTRDMLGVHRALEGALATASGAAAAASDGDTERSAQIGSFLDEVFWIVHIHHDGEDELLYPLLVERAPEHGELFQKMADQHDRIGEQVNRAEAASKVYSASARAGDAAELVEALEELNAGLGEHLAIEEEEVLPIAARKITPPEWGALAAHAISSYRGTRLWLPLGLVIEAMPPDIGGSLMEHMPPPITDMWTGGGSQAYAAEMASLRQR